MDNCDEKPPPADILCKPITDRVCIGSNIWRATRFGALADVRYLSSPNLSSGLRNDLALLASPRLFGKG